LTSAFLPASTHSVPQGLQFALLLLAWSLKIKLASILEIHFWGLVSDYMVKKVFFEKNGDMPQKVLFGPIESWAPCQKKSEI
jgi:hypothetical protein